MSEISIGTINSANVVVGDGNTINLSQKSEGRIWTADDYIKFLDDVRHIDKSMVWSFYIEKRDADGAKNPYFDQILERDLHYLLETIGREGDGDLKIENGDFVSESGDIATQAIMTNLHYLSISLHVQGMQARAEQYINGHIEGFAQEEVLQFNYTPDYREKLDELVARIRREYNEKNKRLNIRWTLKELSNSIEMNVPLSNLIGLKADLGSFIKSFFKRKPRQRKN